jgi:hypothetical protein
LRPHPARPSGECQQASLAEFLAVFAHFRGRIGGRCRWILRSREVGSALAHARKARRQAKPPSRPAKESPQSVRTFSQLGVGSASAQGSEVYSPSAPGGDRPAGGSNLLMLWPPVLGGFDLDLCGF